MVVCLCQPSFTLCLKTPGFNPLKENVMPSHTTKERAKNRATRRSSPMRRAATRPVRKTATRRNAGRRKR